MLPRTSAKRQDLVRLFCCGPLVRWKWARRPPPGYTDALAGNPPRSFRGRLGLDPSEQSIWRFRTLLRSMPS